MPELPEVESIRLKLNSYVVGKTIDRVEVFLPRIIEGKTVRSFSASIQGKTISGTKRIGKYLFFELSPKGWLHVHLRMTGRLIVADSSPKYARVAFHLNDGSTLWYEDSRTLGKISYFESIPEEVSRLVDGLNDSYDGEWLYEQMKRRSAPLKDVLLDQKLIAGIGNIYACEVAHRAKISPYRPANRVTKKEAVRLVEAIRSILSAATIAEGTTFSDFRGADGKPGNYQSQLTVYDRRGQPCPVCGAIVVKEMHHGRGTYFCPKCQRR